ncbi:MAG: M4 family metallopeptidase [Phycisphaerae bacterium]
MGYPAACVGGGLSIACAVAALIVPSHSAWSSQNKRDVVVVASEATGLATFITSASDGPIPLARPASDAPGALTSFLDEYGQLFGITDARTELSVAGSKVCVLGQVHTTYQQYYRGVRVFGGMVKVHQDSEGNVPAANGRFFRIPNWLNPAPALSADDAASVARADVGLGQLAVDRNELVVVDPSGYGDPPRGPHLAYHVTVSDRDAFVHEAFFVDADNGEVLDRWSLTETVLNRMVYFGQNTNDLRKAPARFEGEPPSPDRDANRAYDYSGDFYNFLLRMFGRDGITDGLPYTLNATVHFGLLPGQGGEFCPNAFWDDNTGDAAFCTDVAQDDVVAHEWGHALTAVTAGLIYQNQPGQLNESYSDVWGELIDLFNGDAGFPGEPGGPAWPRPSGYIGPGTDTPNGLRPAGQCSTTITGHPNGVRWLLAEDSTGVNGFLGEIRDMWEPTCSRPNAQHPCCPDRGYHAWQVCGGPNGRDNGGVHSGSGIPNHAFAILTDGKVFNGYTVAGIGPIKAAAVWYRALVYYLTPISDFEDAYAAIKRAAFDLVGTTPLDPRTGEPSDAVFTAADVDQVDLALRAVEMDQRGACGATADVLNRVPPSQCSPRSVLFSDDFEQGAGDWAVENTNPPHPYDWVLVGDLPFGRAGTAWFVDDPRETTGTIESARHSLISPLITIPAEIDDVHKPKLAFTHYVATQYLGDGGNLRISVNGGPWELIETDAFEYNPYNATIQGAITGPNNNNPLEGETAWTGVAVAWGTSVVDLSSFVSGGDTVQVRFDFGKDAGRGYDGWFVDDFVVYVCACDTDAFCDDGVFCNGRESCWDGFCKKGTVPCGDDYCDESNMDCFPAVFWDDFGNGNLRGWELGTPDDTATGGRWVVGNPVGTRVQAAQAQPEDAYFGLGCAYTGENADGQFFSGDVDGGATHMISPSIDLAGRSSAKLSYAMWFYELHPSDGYDDFLAVDVSSDNGASWVNLETVTATTQMWVVREFQLEDFVELTGTLKLRFTAQAERVAGVDDTVEAAIDEVVITAPDACQLPYGDADGNCDIDLTDYMTWIDCMTGPDRGPHDPLCSPFDVDTDSDVDLNDIAALSLLF